MIPLVEALTPVRNVRRDDDVVVTTMSSAKVWMDGILEARGTTVVVLDIQPEPTRPAPKSPGPAAARAAALRQALVSSRA